MVRLAMLAFADRTNPFNGMRTLCSIGTPWHHYHNQTYGVISDMAAYQDSITLKVSLTREVYHAGNFSWRLVCSHHTAVFLTSLLENK